jgi:hypothetical protein
MRVGDLVRIAPYCQNKGELAIVTDVPPWKGEVTIRFLDPSNPTMMGEQKAITSNLILVSGK